MKKLRKWISLIGVIGFILFIYSIIDAVYYKDIFWYTYFTVGGTLFLGSINYLLKNESVISNFIKDKKSVFKEYLIYVAIAFLMEYIGRMVLHLWIIHPSATLIEHIIYIYLITYPLLFFFIYESFILISSKIKSFTLAFTIITIIQMYLTELPNTFVWTWKYTVPYITFEILQVNIIIILLWPLLIISPFLAKRILPVLKIN